MLNSLKALDQRLGGWPITTIKIVIEIVLVYGISSIPFILSALEGPADQKAKSSFLQNIVMVFEDEVAKGQLLTFVCTLIAPVLLWSFLEFKKTIRTKFLTFACFILIVLSTYIHGKGTGFSSPSSFDLYIFAIIVWIASIIAREFPPERTPYRVLANEETDSFVEATRKG